MKKKLLLIMIISLCTASLPTKSHADRKTTCLVGGAIAAFIGGSAAWYSNDQIARLKEALKTASQDEIEELEEKIDKYAIALLASSVVGIGGAVIALLGVVLPKTLPEEGPWNKPKPSEPEKVIAKIEVDDELEIMQKKLSENPETRQNRIKIEDFFETDEIFNEPD